MRSVDIDDVRAARKLLDGVVRMTPLEHSRVLAAAAGGPVHLKCENLQRTGSFKIRGAYTRIARLTDGGAGPRGGRGQRRQPRPGGGARRPAAGHHGHGVHAGGAPLPKVDATRDYGAEVLLAGGSVDEALAAAREYEAATGAVLVHPFDHPDIVAGQGTRRPGDPRAVPRRPHGAGRRPAAAG